MFSALKQTTTVTEDGRIEIDTPDLTPGAEVEVIVLNSQGAMAGDERWDELLNDESKTARFGQWAEMVKGDEAELDLDRL